ncbi:VGLL4 protein, partial [Pseudoatta argentina]
MRTNSRGCLSCQTGRVARARPPARIPLDFRGFQWDWGKNARSQELSPRETCVFFAGAAHCRGATWSDIGERRVTEERSKVTNLHRKPSSAWRKDRRRDPIQNEALDMSRTNNHHNRPSVIVPPTTQVGITIEDSAMTSTTTSTTASGGQRTIIRTTGGVYVSDPAIDEHFKRSLGPKKYAAVFNATTADKETGMSVDDHFAKALGDTWTRLQATNRTKDST